jgi:hypothetical protein
LNIIKIETETIEEPVEFLNDFVIPIYSTAVVVRLVKNFSGTDGLKV